MPKFQHIDGTEITSEEQAILEKAFLSVEKHLNGKNIVKVIYVPNKVINFIVKD